MKAPETLFLLVATLGFGLCYLGVPVCVWISRTLRLWDRPGGHKTHDDSTPLLGGVSIFAAVWISLLGFRTLTRYLEIAPVPRFWDLQLRGLFLGSTLMLVMGLLDDWRGLTPFTKFITQVGAAVIVVLHGVNVSLFLGTNLITVGITVLWIVGITNSFNMLDNMDGLAAGVAGICCLIFSIIAYRQADPQSLLLSVVMLGSLLAFLRYNFEPAEIFMGDAGSGFIGFFLGTLAVSANYLEHSQLRHLPIITPLLIFSVPLFDTFSVMSIRIMEGRSVWEADNKHFSHRLVSLGMSRRGAVLVIYLVTFTVGILATLLSRVNRSDAILLLLHALAIFAIIILLEYAGAVRQGREGDG